MPLPGNAQSQVEWGFEPPAPVKDVPCYVRVLVTEQSLIPFPAKPFSDSDSLLLYSYTSALAV